MVTDQQAGYTGQRQDSHPGQDKAEDTRFFFFFNLLSFKKNLIDLCGCAGSSLLCMGFL